MSTFIKWLWRPVRIPFLLYLLLVIAVMLKGFTDLMNWIAA